MILDRQSSQSKSTRPIHLNWQSPQHLLWNSDFRNHGTQLNAAHSLQLLPIKSITRRNTADCVSEGKYVNH